MDIEAARTAIGDLRRHDDKVELMVDDLIALVLCRLRKAAPHRLKSLKHELRRFDAGKGKWSDDKFHK